MCVPFTTFKRSYHFQAIHGHIFKFWRVKSQSLGGERTWVKWNTLFTRWKFPPKFPEIFCKWKTPGPFVRTFRFQLGPVSGKSRKLFGPESHLWNCQPFVLENLLTCFQGNKKENNCEVWQIKCSQFLSYKGNCDTRKWPVKFRDVWETAPRGPFLESPETLRAIFGCHNSLCISRTEKI